MSKDELGDRMKRYEGVTRTYLTRRTPAIIRLDGKAFHTFTRGFKKPFDDIMVTAMQETMRYLCENIQGCVLGYTQSDEITLVLADWQKLTTAAWFDYNIQKCVSVAASMATFSFNREFSELLTLKSNVLYAEEPEYFDSLCNAWEKGALFDARIFSIPKEEVCNCVLWRQQDATRNSIEAVAQAHFSARELHCKDQKAMLSMLKEKHDIDWSADFPLHLQRGSCCVKEKYFVEGPNGEQVQRSRWVVDKEIPLFVGESREYIESRLVFKESD